MSSEKSKNKRDARWDVVKAVCIILMVTGHTTCPELFKHFFYLFHVGAFFYVSGRFLRAEKPIGGVVRTRFDSLIIPTLTWGIFFVVFHNLFYKIGWEAEEWSVNVILKSIISALVFATPDSMFLGKWFLPCLFFGTILTYLVCKIRTRKIQILIVFITYLVGWIAGIGEYGKIVSMLSRILVSVPLLYMGYSFKRWNHKITFLQFLGAFGLLFLSIFYINIDIFSCTYSYFMALPIYTFCGIVFLLYLSDLLRTSIAIVFNMFSWIGCHTIDILILHVTGFKVLFLMLSLLGICSDYRNALDELWYVFAMAGVAIPLLYVFVKKYFSRYSLGLRN